MELRDVKFGVPFTRLDAPNATVYIRALPIKPLLRSDLIYDVVKRGDTFAVSRAGVLCILSGREDVFLYVAPPVPPVKKKRTTKKNPTIQTELDLT